MSWSSAVGWRVVAWWQQYLFTIPYDSKSGSDNNERVTSLEAQFSPATKMLDQAPAPSPCVSPRPDTLLTHLVSRRARGGPRFVNATPSRRPWRTVSPPAIPPSESSRISAVAPNEHLRSLVEITRRMPPRFQQQSHATPSLQHSSHDDQSPEQQPQPEPRPSPPHLTPPAACQMWGGGAAPR